MMPQVTGCLDASKSSLDPSDTGGQFDVRFPNGAQCAYGGYGASFIQLYVYVSCFSSGSPLAMLSYGFADEALSS